MVYCNFNHNVVIMSSLILGILVLKTYDGLNLTIIIFDFRIFNSIINIEGPLGYP